MGWKPTQKGGVSGEQPAPRRRRPSPATQAEVPAGRTRRARVSKADAALLDGLNEGRIETRPAGGSQDDEADPRIRKNFRLGKRWSQIVTEIKNGDYTWAQFTEGLTPEELARGQLKDINGRFQGRPPAIVPREFHLACFRELKKRFDEEFQEGVLTIAKEYVSLAQSPSLPIQQRAKMMQYAMERVFGGIPKEVLVKQEEPWESTVVGVVAQDGERPADWRARRYDTYNEEDEGSDD